MPPDLENVIYYIIKQTKKIGDFSFQNNLTDFLKTPDVVSGEYTDFTFMDIEPPTLYCFSVETRLEFIGLLHLYL